jgi:hypothetical protein
MNKRLEKRHKRQVARAKEKVRLPEPDLRTQEQLTAAREASRAVSGRRNDPHAYYTTRPVQKPAGPAAENTAIDERGT